MINITKRLKITFSIVVITYAFGVFSGSFESEVINDLSVRSLYLSLGVAIGAWINFKK